jgi:hypothetical protein
MIDSSQSKSIKSQSISSDGVYDSLSIGSLVDVVCQLISYSICSTSSQKMIEGMIWDGTILQYSSNIHNYFNQFPLNDPQFVKSITESQNPNIFSNDSPYGK